MQLKCLIKANSSQSETPMFAILYCVRIHFDWSVRKYVDPLARPHTVHPLQWRGKSNENVINGEECALLHGRFIGNGNECENVLNSLFKSISFASRYCTSDGKIQLGEQIRTQQFSLRRMLCRSYCRQTTTRIYLWANWKLVEVACTLEIPYLKLVQTIFPSYIWKTFFWSVMN